MCAAASEPSQSISQLGHARSRFAVLHDPCLYLPGMRRFIPLRKVAPLVRALTGPRAAQAELYRGRGRTGLALSLGVNAFP
jgi:hypothetical protein